MKRIVPFKTDAKVRSGEPCEVQPSPETAATDHHSFTFIDLFAGIGGIRLGFDEQGGQCVFTSEWNKFS